MYFEMVNGQPAALQPRKNTMIVQPGASAQFDDRKRARRLGVPLSPPLSHAWRHDADHHGHGSRSSDLMRIVIGMLAAASHRHRMAQEHGAHKVTPVPPCSPVDTRTRDRPSRRTRDAERRTNSRFRLNRPSHRIEHR